MASNDDQRASGRSWNPRSGRSLTDILTLAEIERLDGSFKVMQQRYDDMDDTSRRLIQLFVSSEEDGARNQANYLSNVRQEAEQASIFLDGMEELASALQHISDRDDSCEYRYLRYDTSGVEHVTKTLDAIRSGRETLELALSSRGSPSSQLNSFELFYYRIKVPYRGNYQALLSTAKQAITFGYVEQRVEKLHGVQRQPEESDGDDERTDITPRLERELIRALNDLKTEVGDRDFAARDVIETIDGDYLLDNHYTYNPKNQKGMFELASILSEAVPEQKRMRIAHLYSRVQEALVPFEPFAQGSLSFLEERLGKTIIPLSIVHSTEYDPKQRIQAYIDHAGSFDFFRNQICGNIDALIAHAQAGIRRKREGDDSTTSGDHLDFNADPFSDSYDELVDGVAHVVPDDNVRSPQQEPRQTAEQGEVGQIIARYVASGEYTRAADFALLVGRHQRASELYENDGNYYNAAELASTAGLLRRAVTLAHRNIQSKTAERFLREDDHSLLARLEEQLQQQGDTPVPDSPEENIDVCIANLENKGDSATHLAARLAEETGRTERAIGICEAEGWYIRAAGLAEQASLLSRAAALYRRQVAVDEATEREGRLPPAYRVTPLERAEEIERRLQEQKNSLNKSPHESDIPLDSARPVDSPDQPVKAPIAIDRGPTFGVSRSHEEREADWHQPEARDTADTSPAREVLPASPQPAIDQRRHQEPSASRRLVPPPTRTRYSDAGYALGDTCHLPIRINLSPTRFQPKQSFIERAKEGYYNTFWRTYDEANPTPMPIDTWPILISCGLAGAAAFFAGEYASADPDVRSYTLPIAIGSGVAAFHASLYVLGKGVNTIAHAIGNRINSRRQAREERREQTRADSPQPQYFPPDLTSLDSILNVDSEQVAALNEFIRRGHEINQAYCNDPAGFRLEASHVYWLRQALQQAERLYRSREGQSMEAFARTGDRRYYNQEGANEIDMTMSRIRVVWDMVHGIVRDHTHLLSQGAGDPLYRKTVQQAAEIVERSTSLLR